MKLLWGQILYNSRLTRLLFLFFNNLASASYFYKFSEHFYNLNIKLSLIPMFALIAVEHDSPLKVIQIQRTKGLKTF